jgi:hypothetical protein
MAIRRRRHKHGPKERKKHVEELSRQLAPLEELMPEIVEPDGGQEAKYRDATIRVDSASLKLPERLLENDESRRANGVFHLEPVVIVICLILLGWAAFIAYQITLMPPKQ